MEGIDVKINDKEQINSLKIIHTPRHTLEHICIYEPLTKTMFTGDLIYSETEGLYEPPHQESIDYLQKRRSMLKILEYNFQNLYPAMVNPIY